MSPGQIAPRTRSTGLREKAWWLMRRRISFTLTDLLMVIASPEQKDAASNIRKYLRVLGLVGILTTERRVKTAGSATTSNGSHKYRLINDLGHEAPVWRKTRNDVYDPNSKTAFPIPEERSDV